MNGTFATVDTCLQIIESSSNDKLLLMFHVEAAKLGLLSLLSTQIFLRSETFLLPITVRPSLDQSDCMLLFLAENFACEIQIVFSSFLSIETQTNLKTHQPHLLR